MSEEPLITKRLHISGLTPAISQADLSQKLASFGTVQSLDGFGKLDGLGQPRKFGYITIETTKPKLARCMNLLSGVTWKGAKLRIGEAKPDFRERLLQERESQDEPPRKKRRLPHDVQGVHAPDMSPITPENVKDHPGWRVTPLGRIVRPIRMRPSHPLPETLDKAKVVTTKKVPKKGKRPRVKVPPTRARRRTIDPTKWGSQHLKGIFIESGGVTPSLAPAVQPLQAEQSSDSESEDDTTLSEGEVIPVSVEEKPPSPPESVTPISLEIQPTKNQAPVALTTTDLSQEKEATLGLLQSMFGDRGDDDWFDTESVSSDVDIQDGIAEPNSEVIQEDEMDASEDNDEIGTVDQPAQTLSTEEISPEHPPATQAPQKTKLKDLFGPREEEEGFSLLGHLDLDLELEDDVLDLGTAQTHATTFIAEEPHSHVQTEVRGQSALSTDTKIPLFFPLAPEDRQSAKGRVKDPLDVFASKGWDWRKFCRTESPEETKQWWEEVKGDLTRDWKRRHREAVKSRRRRGGNDGAGD